MRAVALLAIASLATVFACAEAVNTGGPDNVSDAGSGGDSGSVFKSDAGKAKDSGAVSSGDSGSGTPDIDAGTSSDGGTTIPGKDAGTTPPVDSGSVPPPPPSGTCAPGSVTGFVPQWIPPISLHQGVCSTSQINTYVDCLFNANASATTCDAFVNSTANSACMACALVPDTSSSFGAMTYDADNLVSLNIAGCIARTSNNTSASGCGAKVQAASQCTAAACALNCPVTDQASLDARNTCETDAQSGGCATYQQTATTCSDPLLQGASAQCENGTTFEAVAINLATLFCGF